MIKFKFVFFLFCLAFGFSKAQNKLNPYPAVLIPERFSFQDEPNEYNINQILKSSLSKYGFQAFINGEDIPDDLDPCEILRLEMEKKGLLTNKIKLIFSNCYGQTVYTSIVGQSRIKEFQPSYYEAIGLALKDPNITQHKYVAGSVPTKPKKPTATQPKKPEPVALPTPNTDAIVLELRGQKYKLSATSATSYNIYKDNQHIGTLKKQQGTNYKVNAGALTGAGHFDDFGNFVLTRVNPANQAIIKDTLVRVY
ncbi:hypothetical protein [Ochrovirga pacifica]|uniref:hypothetical protein n=1 Tax=Ochrovirga pacifica TaxID=1042376 RepID=UPI000255980A|nr:hypothetical protein [Ochrovirga pacifica]